MNPSGPPPNGYSTQALAQEFFCVAILNFPPTPEPPSPAQATTILSRAINMNATTSFQWRSIDKPSPGTTLLVFLTTSLPPDGIRYAADSERVMRMAAPDQPQLELEVANMQHGFCPPTPNLPAEPQSHLTRYRRRYRLSKGGIPNLCLFYWGNASPDASTPQVPQQWMNEPIRNYPLPVPPSGAVQPLMGYLQNLQKMREQQQQQQQQQQQAQMAQSQNSGMPPPAMPMAPQMSQSQQAQAIMMQNQRRAMEQQARLQSTPIASPAQAMQSLPAGSPPRALHRPSSLATLPPVAGPTPPAAPALHQQAPFSAQPPISHSTAAHMSRRPPGAVSMPPSATPMAQTLPPNGAPTGMSAQAATSSTLALGDNPLGDQLDLAPSRILNNQRMLNNQNVVSSLFENALSTEDVLAKIVLRDQDRGSLKKTPEEQKAELKEELAKLQADVEKIDQKRAQTREQINQARSATWAC